MTLSAKVRKYGVLGSVKLGWQRLVMRHYLEFKWRSEPLYVNPTEQELMHIEDDLLSVGLRLSSFTVNTHELDSFKRTFKFPPDYHGGENSGVWEEKILEHFLAYELCELSKASKEDIYIDVAGAASPWAKMLREKGYQAYSVDLDIEEKYKTLSYYLQENATATSFPKASVRACSLQCAFEMFIGNDDLLFIDECRRMLIDNGVVVIAPLYLHTHHCGYSTLEHYAKGYADKGSKEYIRKDCWGIPFSRKYSPKLLKDRVIARIENQGMKYELYKLSNREELGKNVYCHFILKIIRN